MLIKDLNETYHLCQIQHEFEDLCDLAGLPRYNRYLYGFAKISEGNILELWGYDGFVPYLSKQVFLVYRGS